MIAKFIDVLFLFFVFNVTYFTSAQNLTPVKIDSISKAAQELLASGKNPEYIKIQEYLNQESKKINYSKGIAKSYYRRGIALAGMGQYDKAIESYSDSEKEEYSKTDLILQSETNRFIGECYSTMGLYDIAISKFQKALKLAENAELSGLNVDITKSVNYNDIGSALEKKKATLDSVNHYFWKALFYVERGIINEKKIPVSQKYVLASVITSNIAAMYVNIEKLDSSDYYLKRATEYNIGNKNKFYDQILHNLKGAALLKEKKYIKAIKHYEKAINCSSDSISKYNLKESYKGISEAYKELKDEKNYEKYTDLYIKIDDSLAALEKKGTSASISKIIKDEKKINEEAKSNLYWVIIGILLSLILISIFGFFFYRNMKRKKESIISDSAVRLAKKREIIEQKEFETQLLKLKLNESFDEVVKLAKENSPEFLIRFQEVYPDYHHKLINIEPKLLTTEIKLCAMIYLGFSTKDIAEYTFVTIKAAQHRKFRLRRKLNIPSDIDINAWLDSI